MDQAGCAGFVEGGKPRGRQEYLQDEATHLDQRKGRLPTHHMALQGADHAQAT
jgi:hypothetical protein